MPKISNANKEVILEHLKDGSAYTIDELATRIKSSERIVLKLVSWMVEQSILTKNKSGNSNLYSIPVVEKKNGTTAQSRTVEWKPLGIYNLKQHMDACEGMRTIDNGGLV